MIVASCAAIGFLMSCALSNRAKVLKSFIGALTLLEAEICTRGTSLAACAAIIANAKLGCASSFFETLENAPSGKFSAEYSRELALRLKYDLSDTERDELQRLGAIIGKFDAATQKKAIDRAIANLEISFELAQEKQNTTGRILKAAGVSLGIIIACIAL